MVGAREESMLAMLESVKIRWGSAEGYVRECCGLSEEEVEAVRRVLGARCETPTIFRRMTNFLLRSLGGSFMSSRVRKFDR
jgi:Tyrosine phosphatase family